jgi:hypothetical protein
VYDAFPLQPSGMPRRPFVPIALVALLGLAATRGEAQRRPVAPRNPGPAVVTVLAYRAPRDPVVSLTGFLLADGRVVTALRPLAGATRVEVYNTDGDLLATATSLDAADPKGGIVALPRLVRPPLTLAVARRPVTVGERVTVFLAPRGTTRASAEQQVTALEAAGDTGIVVRLGTPVAPEAIGAPVLDAKGEVVAIALGTMPGREATRDLALDAQAVRRALGRPGGRLSLPARDGSVIALAGRLGADSAGAPAARGARPDPAAARAAAPALPVATDTVGTYLVDLYGCRLTESTGELACQLRIVNNGKATTVAIEGGDIADTTRRRLVEAEAIERAGTVLRIRGWRAKAPLELRELDAVRFTLRFAGVKTLPARTALVVRVGGAGEAWLGPFAPARVP